MDKWPDVRSSLGLFILGVSNQMAEEKIVEGRMGGIVFEASCWCVKSKRLSFLDTDEGAVMDHVWCY